MTTKRVASKLALSLVLLIAACLFLQSLKKLQGSDMKLNATNRYIIHINPQAAGYTQFQLDALYHTMEDRFHALPGVTKVGIASYTPMEDNNNGWGIEAHAHPQKGAISSVIRINGDYFDINASGAPLGGVVRKGTLLKSPAPGYAAQLSIAHGRAEVGPISFTGRLRIGSATTSLDSVNDVEEPAADASPAS